jgi:hypothetical protein
LCPRFIDCLAWSWRMKMPRNINRHTKRKLVKSKLWFLFSLWRWRNIFSSKKCPSTFHAYGMNMKVTKWILILESWNDLFLLKYLEANMFDSLHKYWELLDFFILPRAPYRDWFFPYCICEYFELGDETKHLILQCDKIHKISLLSV